MMGNYKDIVNMMTKEQLCDYLKRANICPETDCFNKRSENGGCQHNLSNKANPEVIYAKQRYQSLKTETETNPEKLWQTLWRKFRKLL